MKGIPTSLDAITWPLVGKSLFGTDMTRIFSLITNTQEVQVKTFLRLALLHLLIRAQFGYNLHPMIAKKLNNAGSDRVLRIADVGTGTGYATLICKDL